MSQKAERHEKLIVTKADCPKLNVRKLNVTKLNVTLPWQALDCVMKSECNDALIYLAPAFLLDVALQRPPRPPGSARPRQVGGGGQQESSLVAVPAARAISL